MKIIRIIITVIFLASTVSVSAQGKKIEREFKVKQHAVPGASRNFIGEVFSGKVKWYQEYNQKGMYYEAKFRKLNISYSIKFDSTGGLYDVEELFKFSSGDFNAKEEIRKYFDSKYKNWRVTRAQKQWIGDAEELKEYVKSGKVPEGIQPNFEVVIRGKNKGDVGYFEFIFNYSGDILSEKRFANDNMNNLIF